MHPPPARPTARLPTVRILTWVNSSPGPLRQRSGITPEYMPVNVSPMADAAAGAARPQRRQDQHLRGPAPHSAHGHAARNPMVWLVVGLPALVIVAAFATLAIAIRAGGSDALPDDVRRMAQIQTTDLNPDDYATAHRLSAVLRIGEDAIEVLPATGDALREAAKRREPLLLALQHPIRAAEDRTLALQHTAQGWRAAIRLDRGHDWRIQLSNAPARSPIAGAASARTSATTNISAGAAPQWRLHGRLPKRQAATLLQPALRAEPPTKPQ